MNESKNVKIEHPSLWDIVTHNGKGQNKKNYPCDIIIESVTNKLYTWRRILPDNTLSNVEKGINDFYKSEKTYNRIISSDDGNPKIKYVIPIKNIKVNIDPSELSNQIIF